MTAENETPYRLTEVRISNVRCFESVSINLADSGTPRSWAVILGDNGVGKTTLLRCIAMGLCDVSSAAGLLRDVYGDWNRKVEDEWLPAEIDLRLHDGENELEIQTKILQQGSVYSRIEQTALINGSDKDFPWNDIFACGYGAARRSFATRDFAEYATIDAVYTLFNYDQSLQNPELVLRRLLGQNGKVGSVVPTGADEEMGELLSALASVLLLDDDAISLTSSGLMVKGPWGAFQPIGGLGDGYQATLSWITDLLGWAMLYDGARALKNVSGIVLIDELEQHLHPRWQRQIIKLLRDQFQNVQFITTTHTPMCAIGTSDLADGECELIKLEREETHVFTRENLRPPKGQRADQVLTGLLFDLPTTSDDYTLQKIVELNRLEINRSRSEAQEKDVQRLRRELSTIFSGEETEFETAIMNEVDEALKKKSYENISSPAARLEVLKILRELE